MEKKLVFAPIDNKNIMEDAFEDGVFANWYAAYDYGKNGKRHLFLFKDEAYVEVQWNYGSYQVEIKVIAVNPSEDFDAICEEVLESYKEEFSSWQCEENEGLVVKFSKTKHRLLVSFFFEIDD